MLNNRLKRASWRHFLHHPLQSLLCLLGIVLGVAVVLAVELANQSSHAAMDASLATLSGRATHRIESLSGGFDEAIFGDLVRKFPQLPAAPLLEAYVRVKNRSTLVLGVDPFAELGFRDWLPNQQQNNSWLSRFLTDPQAALVSTALQSEVVNGILNVYVGNTPVSLEVIGSLETEQLPGVGEWIVLDLATMQELLGRFGKLDRIELRIEPSEMDQLAEYVTGLGSEFRLTPVQAKRLALQQMTQAFRTNLLAMSLLALVVGGFLIFNAMVFAVVQRQSIFATLRALGATPLEILGIVLWEAFVLGLVASPLGLLTGWLLAELLLANVLQTIADLYFKVSVARVELSWASWLKAFFLGISVSCVAAIWPAMSAGGVVLGSNLKSARSSSGTLGQIHWVAMLGALACVAAFAIIAVTANLWLGFAGLALLILGYSAALPWTSYQVVNGLQILSCCAPALLRLVLNSFNRGLGRTGPAIAALAVAVAASISVATMIDSFRRAVETWLSTTLRADIYVSARAEDGRLGYGQLDRDLVTALNALTGVSNSSYATRRALAYEDRIIELFALQPAEADLSGFDLVQGERTAAVVALLAHAGVWVSEPFASHFATEVGDYIDLDTPLGVKSVAVAGVYRDYGSDSGVVLMHWQWFSQLWDDRSIGSIGLYVAADEAQMVAQQANALANSASIVVSTSESIRTASLQVFDRTFAVTEIVRLLVTAVAFIGVLSALLALQLERLRELSVLRAIGTSPLLCACTVLGQAALLGLLAGVFALPLGILMAWMLIAVINQISFGWSMSLVITPAILGSGFMLAVLASLAASVWPSWRTTQIKLIEGLRLE